MYFQSMDYGGDKEQLDEELAASPEPSESPEEPLQPPPAASKTRDNESKKISENLQCVKNELNTTNEENESDNVVGEDGLDAAVHEKISAVHEKMSGVHEKMSGDHKKYAEMCGEQLNNILQILVTVTELNDKIEVNI